MESKIYDFFNRLYKYFKVSIWYWVYLMKGIIIYGVFPATCTLFSVMNELHTNDKDDPEPRELFSKHYSKYKKYKIQSFVFSMIIILLYTGLIYVNQVNSSIAMMLKVIFIYFGSMAIILFAYTIHDMVKTSNKPKQSFTISFIKMIKNFFTSMWVLIFSVGLIIIGIRNLVILIFIVPFLYTLGVELLLRDTTS